MKRFFALILCAALLAGCAGTSLPTDSAGENVQQIQYDWMAGESPVSPERTGTYNNAIDQLQNGFEVTESGCYWMCEGILLYCDHGSDEVIRLCGRPDCQHQDYSCNAHFNAGRNICYYDGYLYVTRSSELLRLNLDGNERITVLKPVDLVQKGGIGCRSPHICNGVYSVGLFYLDENGVDQCDYYYTTLDSGLDTMEQMVPCGVAQTVGDKMTVMDHEDNKMYLWDPKNNETTFLTEATGRGYYGETENWYIQDGVIYRNVYVENKLEAMLDTRLDGGHALHCFHDCIVVSNYPTDEQWANFEKVTEQILRFYNWEFEFLGEVKLNYPGALEPYNPICGESHERIYMADSMDHVPRYYIEKADLGTENITIHKLNLPDDLERMLDEDGGVGIFFGS